SKATSTSSSMVKPRPPYSSGIDKPNKPMAFISSMIAVGISSVSETCCSRGTNLSRTKRLIVSSNWLRTSWSRIMMCVPFSYFLTGIRGCECLQGTFSRSILLVKFQNNVSLCGHSEKRNSFPLGPLHNNNLGAFMLNAWFYDGIRTPFGRHGGALSSLRPDDMLAEVLRNLVARNPFAPELYEDVVAGNTNQAGEDARNVARHAGLLAGLPVSVAGITVNRLCGSGLAATLDAARMVSVNEADLVLAAGVESMSRAPFVVAKNEQAFSRQFNVFDSTIGARFPNPKVEAEFGADSMPETAQNIA